MDCKRCRLLVAMLLLFSAIATSSGCSMFQQRPQKTGPTTVEGWMAQPLLDLPRQRSIAFLQFADLFFR